MRLLLAFGKAVVTVGGVAAVFFAAFWGLHYLGVRDYIAIVAGVTLTVVTCIFYETEQEL